jgi:hypothetical protein
VAAVEARAAAIVAVVVKAAAEPALVVEDKEVEGPELAAVERASAAVVRPVAERVSVAAMLLA